MIKVIGKTGCNRCTMTKNILTNKNVEFEYLLFEDLSSDEQNKYMLYKKKGRCLCTYVLILM